MKIPDKIDTMGNYPVTPGYYNHLVRYFNDMVDYLKEKELTEKKDNICGAFIKSGLTGDFHSYNTKPCPLHDMKVSDTEIELHRNATKKFAELHPEIKTPLSNCCGAEMKLSQGDEGTNCFVCTKCNHVCDMKPMEIPKNAKLEFTNVTSTTWDASGNQTTKSVPDKKDCCKCNKNSYGWNCPCKCHQTDEHNYKLQEATNRAYKSGQENGKKQGEKVGVEKERARIIKYIKETWCILGDDMKGLLDQLK